MNSYLTSLGYVLVSSDRKEQVYRKTVMHKELKDGKLTHRKESSTVIFKDGKIHKLIGAVPMFQRIDRSKGRRR